MQVICRAVTNIVPPSVTKPKLVYERGMPVEVLEDGVDPGRDVKLPGFVILHIPGVPAMRGRKYIEAVWDEPNIITGEPPLLRRRRWQLRWDDLPVIAKTKLETEGTLTIKVGDYSGPYDYTWVQVRHFLHDHVLGINETGDL